MAKRQIPLELSMKGRVRWFTVGSLTREVLGQLSAAMLKAQYSSKARIGFRLSAVRPDSLEGTFIERIELIEKIVDPFGKTVKARRTRYKQIHFFICVSGAFLEAYDSPRSLGQFFNQLSKFSKRRITFSPMEGNVSAWIKAIEERASSLKVTAILLGGLSLSSTTSGRAFLKSSEDVRPYLEPFVGGRDFVIERAEIQWGKPSTPNRCELRHNGRADFISGDKGEILKLLRESLLPSAEKR